jgi:acyl-CoA thioesterase
MSLNQADSLAQVCAQLMYANDNTSQSMGMKIEKAMHRQSTVSMRVTKEMLNGHQTCHGGKLFSLADSAFAFACNSENQAAVAAHCTIDFIRPAYLNDLLTASATAVHQGSRSGVYQVEIVNQDDQLIAFFMGSSARINQFVLPSNKRETSS